jgi:AraC-like DNA-binding protein
MKINYLLLPIFFLLIIQKSNAQKDTIINGIKTTQIEAGTDYVPLRESTYYLIDDGTFQPNKILSGELDSLFKPIGNLSFPAGDSVKYWGRVSLQFLSENKLSDFFFAFVGRVRQIELFTENYGQIVTQRTGKAVPFHERASTPPFPLKFHGFYVTPPNDTIQTLYFRVTHAGGALINSRVHPYFYSKECLYIWGLRLEKRHNLYLGGILIFLIIALSLFIFNRRRVYCFYFLYLFFILIYLLLSSGYLERWLLPTVFKNAPMGIEYFMLVTFLIAMSYIAFIRRTIDVKNLLPFWFKLFRILIWIGAIFVVVTAIWLPISHYNPEEMLSLVFLYSIPCLIVTTVFLIPLYRTKSRFKIFVILGILCLNIGSAITIFKSFSGNLLPKDVIWMQLGALGEIIIFAIGLSFRQRIVEKEKLKFQSLLEKHLTENDPADSIMPEIKPNKDLVPATPTNSFLENTLTIINQNIENQEFGVEELVKKTGISRSQFHRKITEVAGVSANQLIKLTRLTRGKELLKNQQLNVSEVAYSVGFSDPGYFSKVFKKEFGVSPKEFREKW